MCKSFFRIEPGNKRGWGGGVQDCHSKCYTEVSHTGTGDMTSGGGDEEGEEEEQEGLPVTATEAKLTLTSGEGNLAERVEKLHGLPDSN